MLFMRHSKFLQALSVGPGTVPRGWSYDNRTASFAWWEARKVCHRVPYSGADCNPYSACAALLLRRMELRARSNRPPSSKAISAATSFRAFRPRSAATELFRSSEFVKKALAEVMEHSRIFRSGKRRLRSAVTEWKLSGISNRSEPGVGTRTWFGRPAN